MSYLSSGILELTTGTLQAHGEYWQFFIVFFAKALEAMPSSLSSWLHFRPTDALSGGRIRKIIAFCQEKASTYEMT
jgi:hypothetical protein